jgi:hypothetical protein
MKNMFYYRGFSCKPTDNGWDIFNCGIWEGWCAGSSKDAKQSVDQVITKYEKDKLTNK